MVNRVPGSGLITEAVLAGVKSILDAVTSTQSAKADLDSGGKLVQSQVRNPIIVRTADQGIPTVAECINLQYPHLSLVIVPPAQL